MDKARKDWRSDEVDGDRRRTLVQGPTGEDPLGEALHNAYCEEESVSTIPGDMVRLLERLQ